uniref:Uncharacterized protein n=1 Tax=Panagrolaimus sp. PS1159 TaxID=55785 RepID=A0AC35G447_9BILA
MTPFTAVILSLKIIFTCTIFFKTSKAQYTLPEFRATEAPEMPKGIFSYQKAETSIKNEMHVPNADFSKPMEIATELINTAVAKASHRNEGFSGVKIPLPFGLSPLNLQLSQNSETQMGVSHENDEKEKFLTTTVSPSPSSSNQRRRAPDLNSRTRSALESARMICIKKSQRLCDAALDKYHQLKFGRSVAEDRKQLRKVQPQDWATYIQTGIAKWFVPGLDNQLNKILLNQTTTIQSPTTTISPTTQISTESTTIGISISNSKTIRFKPKRIKTILPARRKIFLPPRR